MAVPEPEPEPSEEKSKLGRLSGLVAVVRGCTGDDSTARDALCAACQGADTLDVYALAEQEGVPNDELETADQQEQSIEAYLAEAVLRAVDLQERLRPIANEWLAEVRRDLGEDGLREELELFLQTSRTRGKRSAAGMLHDKFMQDLEHLSPQDRAECLRMVKASAQKYAKKGHHFVDTVILDCDGWNRCCGKQYKRDEKKRWAKGAGMRDHLRLKHGEGQSPDTAPHYTEKAACKRAGIVYGKQKDGDTWFYARCVCPGREPNTYPFVHCPAEGGVPGVEGAWGNKGDPNPWIKEDGTWHKAKQHPDAIERQKAEDKQRLDSTPPPAPAPRPAPVGQPPAEFRWVLPNANGKYTCGYRVPTETNSKWTTLHDPRACCKEFATKSSLNKHYQNYHHGGVAVKQRPFQERMVYAKTHKQNGKKFFGPGGPAGIQAAEGCVPCPPELCWVPPDREMGEATLKCDTRVRISGVQDVELERYNGEVGTVTNELNADRVGVYEINLAMGATGLVPSANITELTEEQFVAERRANNARFREALEQRREVIGAAVDEGLEELESDDDADDNGGGADSSADNVGDEFECMSEEELRAAVRAIPTDSLNELMSPSTANTSEEAALDAFCAGLGVSP
eukprot:COSAG01_NODE_110_length_25904_cov_154.158806_18_plen_627_part_00